MYVYMRCAAQIGQRAGWRWWNVEKPRGTRTRQRRRRYLPRALRVDSHAYAAPRSRWALQRALRGSRVGNTLNVDSGTVLLYSGVSTDAAYSYFSLSSAAALEAILQMVRALRCDKFCAKTRAGYLSPDRPVSESILERERAHDCVFNDRSSFSPCTQLDIVGAQHDIL